ncbi:MAG TPA: hypothetical protein VFC80_06215 [Sphaerochaeta sp.]|nr:hypothetical protein [Sphaerochaeta sp.]
MKQIAKGAVVALIIVSLIGCSMGWEVEQREALSDELLIPRAVALIEEHQGTVWPYLEAEFSDLPRGAPIDSETIVANTLAEADGRAYLEFLYTVGEDEYEAVLEVAYELLDEEGRAELDQQLRAVRTILEQEAAVLARSLAPSQRAPFWKDMQRLVTRTLVLFTAGVVYACMPTTLLWGKVAAAAGIAVATGAVATTVMSIWRYYQFGGSAEQSFVEWIAEVTTEPDLAYALAASMIATGKTAKRSPIVTGVMLCVFAIYNVIDMVRPMLKKYNFTV